MIRKLTLIATAVAAIGGCARTSVQSASGELGSAVPPNARRLTVGTMIDVKTNSKLSSKHNKVGDTFSATVSDAVMAQNGQTVVPEGSMVYGHITGLQNAPKTGDASVIRVDFDRIAIKGRSYPFNASVAETRAPSTSNETLKKAGIGAVVGSALGAIVSGGDLDKLLLGGALGAATGTVISLGTDREPELPSGTRLRLRTSQNIALR
jgi:hypothetical protein